MVSEDERWKATAGDRLVKFVKANDVGGVTHTLTYVPDVNHKCDDKGAFGPVTALQAACMDGRTEMVVALLAHPEIDVNVLTKDNFPMLYLCLCCPDQTEAIKIAKLLLSRKDFKADVGKSVWDFFWQIGPEMKSMLFGREELPLHKTAMLDTVTMVDRQNIRKLLKRHDVHDPLNQTDPWTNHLPIHNCTYDGGQTLPPDIVRVFTLWLDDEVERQQKEERLRGNRGRRSVWLKRAGKPGKSKGKQGMGGKADQTVFEGYPKYPL